MARICPDCQAPMTPLSFFGVMLDTCADCAGIFFDDGEMAQIKAAAGSQAYEMLDEMVQPHAEFAKPDDVAIRICPSCKSEMKRIRYMYSSPVFIDSCEGCGGVWIENGELQQMRDYLQLEREKRPTVPGASSTESALQVLTAAEREKARKAWATASLMASQRFKR